MIYTKMTKLMFTITYYNINQIPIYYSHIFFLSCPFCSPNICALNLSQRFIRMTCMNLFVSIIVNDQH